MQTSGRPSASFGFDELCPFRQTRYPGAYLASSSDELRLRNAGATRQNRHRVGRVQWKLVLSDACEFLLALQRSHTKRHLQAGIERSWVWVVRAGAYVRWA
jgi:hypothetical protein